MDVVHTRTAEFSHIEDRIFQCRMKRDAEVDAADAQENFETIMRLSEGRRYAVLVDARVPTNITKEGMEHASQPQSYTNLIAQAIVVNSLPNRLLGNFLIKFYKPSSPTRLFSHYDAALDWLREQVTKEKEGAKTKLTVLA